MRDLIIATTNKGKFVEIRDELKDYFGDVYSLLDFPDHNPIVEDQATYGENAWKKARKIGDRIGVDTLADDSGLEVDALNGRPGIYSSRYGTTDADRIGKLLKELEGIERERRSAMFKSYLAFYMPAEERGYLFYGSVRGHIEFVPRGEGGFGFDPIFFLPKLGKCMAELTLAEKNRISHRGRALASFRRFLQMGFTQ
jgi:XTP/dITP diphosphohydrolase